MNNKLIMALTFATGAVIGFVSAYKLAEKKYSLIADEEIKSVIDQFTNREPLEVVEVEDKEKNRPSDKPVSKDTITKVKSSRIPYGSVVNSLGYDTESTVKDKSMKEEKKEPENTRIYVVSPEEFNTVDGFDARTLYYSDDHYVVDDDGEVLTEKEIKETIGRDPYGNFGEYEDDCVYVRNIDLMCDFEILLSLKTAEELKGE